MKKEATMTSYTSPFTGKVYEIVPNMIWRQAWDEQGNAYKRWYTQYNFFHSGKRVTWTYTLDENVLDGHIGELEGHYAPWTTSPRD